MKITNRYNLPSAVLKAIEYDPHGGEADRVGDISVTELIQPPQKLQLERLHWYDEGMTADASDQVPRLIGSAIHAYLARFAKDENTLTEEDMGRLTMDVTTDLGTWRVSGQADAFEMRAFDKAGKLIDYKYTNPWAFIFGDRTNEWAAQLNLYRLLLRANDLPVNRLVIVPILREWDPLRAADKEDRNYPPAPSFEFKIKRWNLDDSYVYLKKRVRLHQRARLKNDIVPCTNDERWYRGEQYAVMNSRECAAFDAKTRKTKPRALAVFGEAVIRGGDLKAAMLFADQEQTTKKPLHVETRRGTSIRCGRYCDAGRCGFCPQRKQELAEERIT